MTVTVDTSVSPLLDARTDLATAIETATGYQCHTSPEAAIATPCYALQGDGWVSDQNADFSVVIYRIIVTCFSANQAGDLADGVEELARLAWVACLDHGCRMLEAPAPGAVSIGNTEYAGVQFTATLLVTIRSI